MVQKSGFRRLLALALLALVVAAGTPTARAEGPTRAALVVVFEGGRVETRCVAFAGPHISGLEVLRRGGFQVTANEVAGLGAAVCAIEGVGCAFPAEDCFCQCRGASCRYWNYWRVQDGAWRYSPLGASSGQVGDGGVEGWVWGDGKSPPPPVTFAEVCLGARPTPAPKATATATLTATATATPEATTTTILRTATEAPSATTTRPPASPTATPSAAPTATPSPRPTITPRPGPQQHAPATPSPSRQPPTPTPSPPGAAPAIQYGAFGGMAALLAALFVLALVRRAGAH